MDLEQEVIPKTEQTMDEKIKTVEIKSKNFMIDNLLSNNSKNDNYKWGNTGNYDKIYCADSSSATAKDFTENVGQNLQEVTSSEECCSKFDGKILLLLDQKLNILENLQKEKWPCI